MILLLCYIDSSLILPPQSIMRFVADGGCGIIGMSQQLWDEFRILDFYNEGEAKSYRDNNKNAPRAIVMGSLMTAMKIDLEVDKKAYPYYVAVIRR